MLVHKGAGFGEKKGSNPTVVTDAKYMSDKWEKVGAPFTPLDGTKVGDLMDNGRYGFWRNNCNVATAKHNQNVTTPILGLFNASVKPVTPPSESYADTHTRTSARAYESTCTPTPGEKSAEPGEHGASEEGGRREGAFQSRECGAHQTIQNNTEVTVKSTHPNFLFKTNFDLKCATSFSTSGNHSEP